MSWHYTPYALLMLLAAVASLLLAFYAWRLRGTPGAPMLALMMVAGTTWSTAYGLEMVSSGAAAKFFWANLKYLGIVTVPLFWMLFALLYTGRGRWVTRRALVLLAVIPAISLALIWTNGTHHLFWSFREIDTSGPFPAVGAVYAPWFWFHTAYSYLLILVATVLLVRALVSPLRLYRGQRFALLIGVLVPWASNAASLYGLNPVPNLDPTPLAFTVTGVALSWSLLRYRFLDVLPVARDVAVDAMQDGVIVLDLQNRVVDLNPTAQRVLDRTVPQAVGESLAGIAPDLAGFPERRPDAGRVSKEVSLGAGETRRHYNLTLSPLRDGGGLQTGFLMLLQDITEQKRAEEALKESEERHRGVLEQMEEGYFEVDLAGNLVFFNDSVCRILGYPREELMGMNNRDFVDQESAEKVYRHFNRVYRTGEPVKGFDWELTKKNGGRLYVETSVSLRKSPGGEPVGFKGVVRDVSERKKAEASRRKSEERFRSLVQNASDLITVVDATGTITYESPSKERILGYGFQELVGRPVLEHVHPDDLEQVSAEFINILSHPGYLSEEPAEFWYRHADGTWRYLESLAANLLDDPGVGSVVITSRDVTERKQAEEELRDSEERFRTLVQNASDIISILNPDGTIRYVSPSVEWVLGYQPDERVGRDVFGEETHPDDTESTRDAFAGGLERPGSTSHLMRFRVRHKNGSWRHLEAVAANRLDHPAIEGIVVNARDVTERKAYEERLRHQALHDGLTGLPNRALFLDRLSQALTRQQGRNDGDGEKKVAVLFLDLDNFKYVNDSLGHEIGDRMLVEAARRLEYTLRPSDTAARIGGDEFCILLTEVEEEGEVVRVARRISEALEAPFVLGVREALVTASVGVALGGSGGPADGPANGHAEAAQLLKRADLAMYEAKNGGKARYAVFDPEFERRSVRRLELENGLRRAIERDEIVVLYQPVVSLKTGLTVGFEALARWEHPGRGLVYPADFIPLAEETGLIVPIGRRVLHLACRCASEWKGLCPDGLDPIVGINISARQLSHPDLIEHVEEALNEFGLNPERLTLEITESVLVEHGGRHADALRGLQDLGVRLAIDDFGTGYSSLSYLRNMPVGMLKIDRSFVESVGQDEDNAGRKDEVLLSGVVGIAHGLDMRVLAEGVETTGQLDHLKALGCDLAQGHLFSRPLPGAEATKFLRKVPEGSQTGPLSGGC